MSKKVEGVYPTLEGARQAIERLKNQGYSRNEITVVANAEVRKQLTKKEKTDIHTEEIETEQTTTPTEKRDSEDSLWDSIKDFFTMDDSNEDSDLLHKEDPAYEYKDQIEQGQLVIVVDVGTDQSNQRPMTNTQPNTVGPEGTRSYEEEQALGSKDNKPKDHELSTDELDNYERHQ